jgi:ABC-type Zn uptake system ZnuABC Zn-binding protein ZnuA
MKIALPAVVKKDGKWYQGFLEGTTFTENKEIKKLSDIKNVAEYKGILAYFISMGYDRKLADDILEKTGLETIYILNKPVDLTVKQLNAYMWSDYFPLCKSCKKKCKQSHIAKDVYCKQFEKV